REGRGTKRVSGPRFRCVNPGPRPAGTRRGGRRLLRHHRVGGRPDMSKSIVAAACAAILAGTVLPGASPAAAGDRHHHREIVRYGHVPWYHQEPWIGTGPGTYYSQHPDHIPAYPKKLTGYAVPIYDTSPPVVRLAPRYRVSGHEA